MKQIRPIKNSIDMINDTIDILTMPNIIKTTDTIQLIQLDSTEAIITINIIVDERKYKIILHNQTVRINRLLYYGSSSENHSTSWNYGRKPINDINDKKKKK